jgi:hypothetical protein
VFTSTMLAQESPEALDAKIQDLEREHQTMLARIREINLDPSRQTSQELESARSKAAQIIEEFVSHALVTNVKG